MKPNSKPNSEMVKLSRAITKALLKSEEVLSILAKLKNGNRLKQDALIAFILKANDLLKVSQKTQEGSAPAKPLIPKKPILPSPTEKRETYIDGKKLTQNELLFQEFLSKRFDEETWLENNGLNYDQ